MAVSSVVGGFQKISKNRSYRDDEIINPRGKKLNKVKRGNSVKRSFDKKSTEMTAEDYFYEY